MKKKRLLLLSPTLAGGGIERLVSLLLKHLSRRKFELVLVVLQDRFDFPVPENVRIICLNRDDRSVWALPGLIRHLAQVYEKEKPDTVFSTYEHINLIAVLAKKLSRTKPRLVLGSFTHTSTLLKHGFLARAQALLIPYLYAEADAIICISRGVAKDLSTKLRLSPQKMRLIYGSVDIDYILNLAKEQVGNSNFHSEAKSVITAMGRLMASKGYTYLLKAFAQVAAKFPCQLVILGEGKERMALEKLASELQIEGQVAFLSFQRNPFKYLARSDIFVLSSLYEGFGLVIIEAMACGIPVISTQCPAGPDEVIIDGVNGLLVPVADETSLAEAMLRLLKDKKLAVKLAQAGRKKAEEFAVAKNIKKYEMVF